MTSNPHDVTRQFEVDLCEYTGAKFAVATNACTNALLVCLDYFKPRIVHIPRKTYRGVAQSILNAGARVSFEHSQQNWSGSYQLEGTPIYDCARRFTSGMYIHGQFQCVSFHYSKILNITQGGAILHDDALAQTFMQAMTYDGALFGVDLHRQRYIRGWHCYMGPEVAALGRVKLACLPKHNPDLPNSDYPDLSLQGIFA